VTRPIPPALSWLPWLLLCAVVVAFLFQYVDLPVARYFSHDSRYLDPLGDFFAARIVLSGESAALLGIVLVRLVRGGVAPFWRVLAIACLASICAYAIDNLALKVLFGVPDSWAVMHGIPHAINWGMGTSHSSFPSGHMVLAAAFAGVMMRYYKSTRWPLAALLLLAAALMLVGEWHFASDLVAGAAVGLAIGLLAADACGLDLSP
jgi:membrane-associated phospholipid phosphatase